MIYQKRPVSFIIPVLLMLLMSSQLVSSQDSISKDFCITVEELKLYNLINDYRKTLNLYAIPLSNSLCYVARQHALDLVTNQPDTNTCNFHSWSNKGNWKPCCFEKEIKDKSCMLDKPGEITKYPGKGYEVIYWENKEANAEKAFLQWKDIAAANAMMTNSKEWERFTWNAIGIGIYDGFAVAWFGPVADIEKFTRVCGSNQVIENKPPVISSDNIVVSAPTGRYYIIFGSFATLNEAKAKLKKYNEEGFKKAKVVTKDNKFRISLSDYSTKELANEARKELPAKYKDAWILPY